MNSYQKRKQGRKDKRLLISIFKEYLIDLYEVKNGELDLDVLIIEIEEILDVLHKC